MKGAEDKKFDSRLTERNLEDGTLPKKELNEYLHKLPDLSDEAEWVNYREEPAEPGEKPEEE